MRHTSQGLHWGTVPAFHIENFGCRASQADGEALAAALGGEALVRAGSQSEAGLVIVNTCAVTAEAEGEARAYVRRVQRHNPGARVVVTGCYAQRAPEEVAALPGVAAVVGNSHRALLPGVAQALLQPGFVPVRALTLQDDFAHLDLSAVGAHAAPGQGRTRPHLRAQDGCGHRCSFCIIPTTRGPSRSVGLEQLLEQARGWVEGGAQELILTGINLGRWGRDLPGTRRLHELVRALLERTGLARLRLSSVEPMDWGDELLGVFAEFGAGEHPRLARHAHLPLQSGSDEILRRMHRRYRPWHYAERLRRLHALAPGAALGADVMVGFPGETKAHFEETLRFLEGSPLTYLHLFPFSPRPGTAAAKLAPVPAEAVRERMGALRSLARSKAAEFRRGQAGRVLSAVTLHRARGDGATEAVSDNYLRLLLPGPMPANLLINAVVRPSIPPCEEETSHLTGHGPPLAAELATVAAPGR